MVQHSEESILALKIKLERHFQEIRFEELPHTYHVGDRQYNSVSKFISGYTNFFDANTIAGYVAAARGRKEGRFVDKEEILQEWEESKNFSCDLGTNTHAFAEVYPTQGGEPQNEFEVAVISFWNWLPPQYIPISYELQMYCKKKGIAGTGDVILLNIFTGKLVIVDYKTNKDLYKNYKKQTLKAPFSSILDCPIGKYTIQLSFYQLLVEQIEGVEVEERWIVWLKPDATFEIIKTDDVRHLIEKQFNF